MRCLVTGASGFIGAHLVRWLIKQNCQVAVLVRPASNLWRLQDVMKYVHIIRTDLANVARHASEINRFMPEFVFHLGWNGVSGSRYDDPAQIENLYSSLNLLQVIRSTRCQCWIGLGSQEEYSPHAGIIKEQSPQQPDTVYGITKLCVMQLSKKICKLYNLRFVWLRLFAAFGPMGKPDSLIPYVIRTLLNKSKPLLTAGKQKLDYLYVEDAVEAMGRLAKTADVEGVFNLGSGQAYTIRELVEHIRGLIDPTLPLGWGELVYRKGQPMHWQADISKLQNALDWKPHTSLEIGLAKTIEWYRMHDG